MVPLMPVVWTIGDGGKGTHFRGKITGLGDHLYPLLIYSYCPGTHFFASLFKDNPGDYIF